MRHSTSGGGGNFGGVAFSVGQPVAWPPAPLGAAQVEELRRSCVRLVYRCDTGTLRRPVVPAAELAKLQRSPRVDQPLPWPNFMRRGALPRTKVFPIEGASHGTNR